MLTDLYIDPNYRKQGLGYLLMEQVMNQAKYDGYRKINLNSSEMGKYLYKKYGFTDVENEMSYKFY